MKVIVSENQYNRLFEENAASNVMKKMGYKEPPDPWKKKELNHVDPTGLIGENEEEDTRKPYTDSNGLHWVPAKWDTSKKLYMLGGNHQNVTLKESKQKQYGGLDWLKNHQVELTPEEESYFKDKGVLYWDGNNKSGKLIHKGKAKDEKDGEVFFAFTHRAASACPISQKSKAVEIAKFIKTTS